MMIRTAVFVGAALLVLPGVSLAQRDNIDFVASCECLCEIDTNDVYVVAGPYSLPLGGCNVLNGKTCNREVYNPSTGVRTIRSGTLWGCVVETDAAAGVGARAEQLDPGEPQPMTPLPLFNKQLILQPPAAEPGKKPTKKKPVLQFEGVTVAPQ